MTIRTRFFLLLLILFYPMVTQAQAPDTISVQGRLVDTGDNPVNDTLDITTTFYKDGVAGYSQVHPNVTITDGLFNVNVGPVDTVAFDRPIDVGIQVGADPEIVPRISLQSVPFALGLRGLFAESIDQGNTKGYNIVGGGPGNTIPSSNVGGTIAGGGGIASSTPVPNSVTGNWGTIGGGASNTVTAIHGTIGGGFNNTASSFRATVGGGQNNIASGDNATVAGGNQDTASFYYATVGGGQLNKASEVASTVGGGEFNKATAQSSTVSGGDENRAIGGYSTVVGGMHNIASGEFSSVLGGEANLAQGSHSVALGKNARALHQYSFVWNAAFGADTLVTTGSHQFMAKAMGGVWFYSSADTSMGVRLLPNTGSWISVSSADTKTNFDPVDGRQVLERLSEVPIRTWRYKPENDHVRHMGPTAEEFYEAFGLGPTTKGIMTVDADGVALAAIQGLYKIVQEQQAEIEQLRAMLK